MMRSGMASMNPFSIWKPGYSSSYRSAASSMASVAPTPRAVGHHAWLLGAGLAWRGPSAVGIGSRDRRIRARLNCCNLDRMPRRESGHLGHLPALDGFRAVAVLLVMGFHAHIGL